MSALYNFFIPGWTAARAENPLLTSLGRRRRARERRMDWLLAAGLVVWWAVCLAGQSLPFRFFSTAALTSSPFLLFVIRYPLEFIAKFIELLGLFVALLIMMRGALDAAQVEDWAAAPIPARHVSHYVWGRAVGIILKAAVLALLPLAMYWITVGQGLRGIGNWDLFLFYIVFVPVSLIVKAARFYLMALVMAAILSRRRLETESGAECLLTGAGVLIIFTLFESVIGGILTVLLILPVVQQLMVNILMIWVMLDYAAPLLSAVIMILWGRRIARGAAGRFWEWWLDGPRAWRWRWLRSVLLPPR